MNNQFAGFYLKHQNERQTISFIPGRSKTEAFVQVITDERSYHVPYPLNRFRAGGGIHVGNCLFQKRGARIDIDHEGLRIKGDIRYNFLTPIKGDIMGPFRFFPMECRHTVVSMRHTLNGRLQLGDTQYDLTGGVGYIEGDSGVSFPSSYSWVQCGSWKNRAADCSIMISVARIPFAGLHFWGCIAVVWLNGREYRLATYKGVRVEKRTATCIDLRQGNMHLTVDVPKYAGHSLYAPISGDMKRIIREGAAVRARFRFRLDGKMLVDRWSDRASYEYVE